MKTVAEGVETVEQALLLRCAGCDLGQGFLFSAARPAADIPGLTRQCFLRSCTSVAESDC
jgi:EAL domain-containing protein (putative c-di-GMP-specific phosphodiesterase class I)